MRNRLLSLRSALLLIILLGTVQFISAYDFEYNGLYYKILHNNNVGVVGMSDDEEEEGESVYVVVPDNVTYNGTVYTVTIIYDEAFANRGITSVSIPNTLKRIYDRAFCGCESLASVTIPTSVNYLGESAFEGCYSLTEVTVPGSVTTLEDAVFRNSGLTSIHLLNSAISKHMFEGCYNLTEVVIPDNITSIGEYAFSGCSGLTSVTIPTTVTSISAHMFEYCSALESVTIPTSVTSIGEYAFSGCSALESVTIPTTVTYISAHMFEYCSALTSVTMPTSVTSIGEYAFQGSGLTNVTIPVSVKYIGQYAFTGCEDLKTVYFNAENCNDFFDEDYSPFSETVEEFIIGENVKHIPAYCVDCDITSVTIPEGVTSIGVYAFHGCSKLKTVNFNAKNCEDFSSSTYYDYYYRFSRNIEEINIGHNVKRIPANFALKCNKLMSITIPDAVTVIGDEAFYGCTGLTSITVGSGNPKYDSRDNCNAIIETATNTLLIGCQNTIIPSSVTSIGSSSFYGCTGLTSITIPESVTSIGYAAFSGCTSVTKVYFNAVNCGDFSSSSPFPNSVQEITFGNSVTRIPANLAKGFTALTSVTIPETISTIGSYAFSGCTGLTSIDIQNAEIGNYMFQNCTGLTSITIPKSVTFIGSYAFSGCTGLTSIDIQNTVIGNYMFQNCSGLTSVTIPNAVTTIGSYAFSGCTGLTSVTIPNAVTTIGSYAFSGCTGLTSVTISDAVTTIGSYTFSGCTGLMSIEIPASVTSIGNYAFSGCTGLTSVTCWAFEPPTLGSSVFYRVPSDMIVFVPAIAIEAYKSARGWKAFEILPISGGTLSLTVNVPDSVNVTDYTLMQLGISSTDDNKAAHYTITDKTSYRFNGIEKNTTWNVTLANQFDDEFGKIETVEVTDEDLTVTFASLLKPKTVTLTVKTPSGQDVTNLAIITWNNENGELLTQGKQIAGLPPGRSLSYSVKLPQQLATVYSLPANMSYTVKDGVNDVICQLTAIAQTHLSGKVKDAITNQPLFGATISATQSFSGGSTRTLTATTDNQGAYSLDALSAPTTLTVVAQGYITQTINCDEMLTGDNNIILPDVALSPITGAVVNVNLTFTPAHVEGDAGETQNWYSDYNNVDYEVFNTTVGHAITDISVQYPQIVLMEGAGDGDLLELTAISRNDAFKPVKTTVTIADQKATATFDIMEWGKVQATFNKNINPKVTGVLYDAENKLVKTADYIDNTLTINELSDGNYTLITMGMSDFYNSIYDLEQFAEAGLAEGNDYVKNEVQIISGIISQVSIPEVPFFDEANFYYTESPTSFTVNKPSIVVGNYLTYRGQIDFKEQYDNQVNDVQLIVDLPESCPLYENSVMVGASMGGYAVSGNRITIPIADCSDIVRFCAIPTLSGNFTPSAFVKFKLNGKTITQPIGNAVYTAEGLSIKVPTMTLDTVVTISGTAVGVCDIAIYDNDVLIGQTTSLANGTWSTTCELNNCFNLSTHDIYAKVTTTGGLELNTEMISCIYDMSAFKVSKVLCCLESGYIVFDFLDPSNSTRYYSLPSSAGMSRIDYTFTIEFTLNDTTKISNVVLWVKTNRGRWFPLDAHFNESINCWVATTDVYSDFDYNEFPANVAVEYDGKRELVFDANIMTNEIQKYSSSQDEINEFDQAFNLLVDQYQNAEDAGDYLAAETILEEISSFLCLDFIDIPDEFYNEEVYQYHLEEAIALDDTLQLVRDNIMNLTIYDEIVSHYLDNCHIEHASGLTVEQLMNNGFEAMKKSDGTYFYLFDDNNCIKFVDFAIDVFITVNQNEILSLIKSDSEDDWIDKIGKTCDRIKAVAEYIQSAVEDIAARIDDAILTNRVQYTIDNQVYVENLHNGHAKSEPFMQALRTRMNESQKRLARNKTIQSWINKHLKQLMSGTTKASKVAGKAFSIFGMVQDGMDAINKIRELSRFKDSLEDLCDEVSDEKQNLSDDVGIWKYKTGAFYFAKVSANLLEAGTISAGIVALLPSAGSSSAAIGAAIGVVAVNVLASVLFERKYNNKVKGFINRKQNLLNSCNKNNTYYYDNNYPRHNDYDDYEEYRWFDVVITIDPSGFVYEGVPSNRLQGVTTTCYYKETVEDMYGDTHEEVVLWDAEQYGQQNPLLTDENGYYRWDVPVGMWQVKYEKAGYETTYSDWLPVPPPQLDVNIGMVQMRQPEVIKARAYPQAVELEFDKFMLPETLTTDNITVSVNGTAVSGTIELLNAEVDDPNAITSIRRAPGTGLTLASRVRFNASTPFNADHVTLRVKQDVKSYADLQMNEDFEALLSIEYEMEKIEVDSTLVMPYGDSRQLTVTVLPAMASRGKTLTVGTMSTMIISTDAETYTLDSNGQAVLTVHGDLPGMGSLLYGIEGYDLNAATLVKVMMESQMIVAVPTATIASGSEVPKGTAVYLRCLTPGATIYYTLDGSCPCDDTPARNVYDGSPIIINGTMTIKAMATAPEFYDSDVATFIYRVGCGLRGDINGDGEINIADINAGIDIILCGSMSEDILERADVNGDGEVNIADINALIDIILTPSNHVRIKVNCDDLLHMEDVTIKPRDVRTLSVTLDNAIHYSALQCDIVLPAGLTLVATNVIGTNQGECSSLDDFTTRALTYSMGKLPFVGGSQPVLTFTVRADAALAPDAEITLTNIVLADADNKAWRTGDCTARVYNASGINDLTANADRVWVEGKTLCMETRQEGTAQLITVNGMVSDMPLKVGVNRRQLESGIYIVVIHGVSHKIAIK